MIHKATALALLLALAPLGIGEFERGNRLYRQGDYAGAVEAYRAAIAEGRDDAVVHYNLGTALLALERFEEAEQELRAALAATEPSLRQRTHYNIGNRYFAESRNAEPEQQRALLDRAIEAYKDALRLDPTDASARWNLELALEDREESPPSPSESEDQQQQSESEDSEQGEDPQPSDAEQGERERPSGGGAMSQEQAEQILNAVEQDERELYQEQLRRGARETPVLRDW